MKKEQEEFLKILSAYQPIIHKVNLIYFRIEADKEENFQEVVFQLWKSFASLKNREKPASWIYAVAINTSIAKIRKDSKLVLSENFPEPISTDVVEQVESKMHYQRLIAKLHKMNEVDRSIMLLYMEDYSYDEIADIVGISNSNVGVKIFRLKKQLQKQLGGMENERK